PHRSPASGLGWGVHGEVEVASRTPTPASLGGEPPSSATLPTRGREIGGTTNTHRLPPPRGEGAEACERSEPAQVGWGDLPLKPASPANISPAPAKSSTRWTPPPRAASASSAGIPRKPRGPR